MERKALSRDDIIRIFFADKFFANNPALAPIAEVVNPCKIAYVKDASTRCCGGNIGLMFPAIEALFDKLQDLKTTEPEAVQKFCSFLARVKGYENASFTVYYRKQNSGKPIKIDIP